MLQFSANLVALFAKVFEVNDLLREKVLNFMKETTRKVVVYSIDLAATNAVADLLIEMKFDFDGVEVTFIDHHHPEVVKSAKDAEYLGNIKRMKAAGIVVRVATRKEVPACLQLVDIGEAQRMAEYYMVLILADQDTDGLLGSFALAGVEYPGMIEDAAVLDGPRSSGAKISDFAQLYTRALGSLPVFDPKKPEVYRNRWTELAQLFLNMVDTGPPRSDWSKAKLEEAAKEFEASCERAHQVPIYHEFAGKFVVAELPASGNERVDLGTLSRRMERAPACVTAQIKTLGPIVSAGGHDRQISLAVVKDHRADIDLRDAVIGMKSDPRNGVISNTPFLLHVSPDVYAKRVLPWLERKLS